MSPIFFPHWWKSLHNAEFPSQIIDLSCSFWNSNYKDPTVLSFSFFLFFFFFSFFHLFIPVSRQESASILAWRIYRPRRPTNASGPSNGSVNSFYWISGIPAILLRISCVPSRARTKAPSKAQISCPPICHPIKANEGASSLIFCHETVWPISRACVLTVGAKTFVCQHAVPQQLFGRTRVLLRDSDFLFLFFAKEHCCYVSQI